MPEGIFVPASASEIEDGLMKAFRAAVAKDDALGAAAVAQELRIRTAEDAKSNDVRSSIDSMTGMGLR